MLIEFYQISELNCPNVRFYTVKIGTNPATEYRDFVLRMMAESKSQIDLHELQQFILSIGNNPKGAEERFFKKEKLADRIKQPTPESYDKNAPDPKDYGLRLFCLRLSNKVVILFNGGRKTCKDPEACQNCKKHFDMANKLAMAIDEAVFGGKENIKIDDFDILYDPEDYELNI